MTDENDTLWDRWEEVDALFAEVMDLEPAAQEPLLASLADHDPELVAAVRDLLAAAAAPDGRLTQVPRAVWRELRAERQEAGARALDPDERVGPYRVLGELGRGGMATVYRAERADGAFQRQVALKVLRRGLDTDEIVRRFLAERQILSGLDHPHIARLLDGGATSDGRPWLAMELVEGEPIHRWVARHSPTRRARLGLFLQVAEAVQFAHRHLVIHRDLKPSNVLVDGEGRVKLLDFGIAKILDPDADGREGLTRTGAALPLTPAYASPEQLLGETITTASDVFQLGRLLYEIMTGERPALGDELTGAGGDRTTTSPGLPPSLRGDLGLIVGKALRREPERRYASVEQLARDIRRYLDGRPVAARPDSLGYRARRFVARHPAGVAASAVAATLILGFGIVSSFQARRLAVESERARMEAARATAARDLLTDLFEVSDPNRAQGETITARELLDSGAVRVRRDLADQPLLQSEMLATIGRVYSRLGLYDRARPLLDEALRIHRATAVDGPADEVRLLQSLAASTWRSDHDEGVALYEEALALAEKELGPDSPILASILTDFAPRVAQDLEREDRMLDRAVAILRKTPGDHREALAAALTSRANAMGGGPGAVALHREALALRRELYGDTHTAVAASLNDLALTLEPTAPLEADSLLSEAVAMGLQLLGPEHGTTLSMMNSLAGFRRDRGDFTGAEPLYRQVLEARRTAYPGQWQEAYPLHGLGWVLTELGRPEEAEGHLRRALDLLESQLPPDHPVIHIARSTLGRCLAVQGRFSEAEPLLVEPLESVGRPDVIGAMAAGTLRQRVVDFYETVGRPEEAARYRMPEVEGP